MNSSSPLSNPILCILRHAERPPIPPGTFGDELEITPAGWSASRLLGEQIAARHRVVRIRTSPILRCVQTARSLAEGGGMTAAVEEDAMLGAPSVFVADLNVAGQHFLEAGPKKIVRRMVDGERLAGMRSPREGTEILLRSLLREPLAPGLTLCVTHDSILATVLGALTGLPFHEDRWPGYLDAVWVARAEGALQVEWRGDVFRYAFGE